MSTNNFRNINLPVGRIKLMTKYPNVRLTNIETTLAEYSNKICVVHLYTG